MRNSPWPWIVAVCATLLVIVGCRTKEVNPPPPSPLVSLSVSPVNSSIAPGTTEQFTATGTFADNSKRNVTASVTWDSSDTGIAAISNTGLATAATTTGTTVISAISEGITGTTALTISHVNTITVTPAAPPCIAPGTTQQFSATGTLEDSTVQNLTSFATWTSSDIAVATVSNSSDSQGLATAAPNNSGSTNITATLDGVTSSSATLTSSHVQSIAVAPASASIPKGTTQQFTAAGTLSTGCTNTQSLTSFATWTSSNTGVASISNTSGSQGLATAATTTGTTGINAMFDSVTSSPAMLTVTAPVLTSIAVTPANPSIALGQTLIFIAMGTFSDNTTLDVTSSVTWNSSDTGVATISNTSGTRGLATSKAEGATTITASFSGITSNNATLTITPVALESITVAPASVSISLSSGINTAQFTATGTFTDKSTQDLTTSVSWASTNVNIPISSTGKAENTFWLLESTDIKATLSGIASNIATLTFTN